MRIPFRQGIVLYQHPTFLSVGPTYVSISVIDQPLVVAIASGTTDYLHIETNSVPNAWGPITSGVDQWLYWDLNMRTATRTFGITKVNPAVGAIAPISPANDQHWFDTSNGIMKVWSSSSNRWVERVRVFACKLAGGSSAISMSINSPQFQGTQVGFTNPAYVGQILFNAQSRQPLKTPDGKFSTTEDRFAVETLSMSDIKFAALTIQAEAQQNLAPYSIVKFQEFGRVVHADPQTASQVGIYGLVQTGALIGDFVNITIEGLITNPAWDWTAAGINAPLYSDNAGALTTVPVQPGQLPVAMVVGVTSIVLGAPQNKVTVISGSGSVSPATNSTLGTVKINIPPVDPANPIAVGSNDPRLTDSRTPLTHSHPITDVVGLAALLAGYVNKAGDTMLGFLTANADPVNPLHYATKNYVDALGSSAVTKSNGDTVTLQPGAVVYMSAAGNVARSDSDVSVSGDEVFGLIKTGAAPAASVVVVTEGMLTLTTAQWDSVTAQVGGLTDGKVYFLGSTPGSLTTTIGATSVIAEVGRAVSITTMLINIQSPIYL